MRAFNKVFVIALPRCATVSVAQALGIIGLRIAHLGRIYGEDESANNHPEGHFEFSRLVRMRHQIEAGDFGLDALRECQGLADYPVCCPTVISQLDREFPGSLFINVRRDASIERWLQSVEIQFVGTEMLATESEVDSEHVQLMAVMRCFRNWTFGSESFNAQRYLRAYMDYQAWISNYFGKGDRLLEFADVSQLASLGFARICDFLQIKAVPDVVFPSNNLHSQKPRQAFFKALRSGRIRSETGLA